MKKLLDKWDAIKLGHKLHQLQKRYKRARINGYDDKQADYRRRFRLCFGRRLRTGDDVRLYYRRR